MDLRESPVVHAEKAMETDASGDGLHARMVAIGSQSTISILATVVGVAALTVGQPLLGVLAQSPEFFVAKDMSTIEIILFSGLVLGTPILVGLLISLARGVSQWLAGALLVLLVLALVGVLAANGLNRLSVDRLWAVTGSIGFGILGAILYVLSGNVRATVRWLVLAVPIIMAWFLLMAPTSALIVGGEEEQVGHVVGADATYPIVLVVLDELPLTTVMNGSGELVSDQFPGLARLAADGVWYRNATSVADRTRKAVPSIMTGRRIEGEAVPIATDHPNSLFTALDPIYDVSAVESITSICPDTVCGTEPSSGGPDLWRGLLGDSSVVFGHMILPEGLDQSLPPLDTAWEGFGSTLDSPSAGSPGPHPEWSLDDVISPGLKARGDSVDWFLGAVAETQEQGDVVFAHILLPHLPWEHLADGTIVESKGYQAAFGDGVNWRQNPWLRAQALQRHVLATQYADSVIRQMISTLKREGVYANSMIVVVADHGLGFEPDIHRRDIKKSTVGFVSAVPLIVKYPRRSEESPNPGTISDAPVETIDIVPTIMDVIGAEEPYPMDGVSMLKPVTRSERVTAGVGDRKVTFGVDGEEKFATAKRVDELLPGRDPWRLLPDQESADLVGSRPTVEDDPEITLLLDQPGSFESVNPDGPIVPSVVTGTAEGPRIAERDRVAILLRDEVVTVTEVYAKREGGYGFYALVNPDDMVRGDNRIEPVLVSPEGVLVR